MFLCRIPAGRSPQFYVVDNDEIDCRSNNVFYQRLRQKRAARGWFWQGREGQGAAAFGETLEEARARALAVAYAPENEERYAERRLRGIR